MGQSRLDGGVAVNLRNHSPPARKQRVRRPALDYVAYLGLRTVAMMMHCWPVDLMLAVGKQLGNIWWFGSRKHRERAVGNVRRSFPELSARQHERIARRSMQHLAMFAIEVMFTTRKVSIGTWSDHAELRDFQRTLSLLLDRHRGLIMLTGHYGNWEILGYILATLGFSTTSIARPLDNPYINQWVLGVREKMGQRILDKKGALEDVPAVLENGGAVGFIADQNAGKKGMFVDFFGRKASTYKSIGLLAIQHNVPVVIGYARRKGDRFVYEMGTQDIIYPADWADQDDPLRYITQRYTRAIEDFVRADPTQYLWVHRRWKTRPKGEAPEAFD